MELVDSLSQIRALGHFDPSSRDESFIFNRALAQECAEWHFFVPMDLFSMG